MKEARSQCEYVNECFLPMIRFGSEINDSYGAGEIFAVLSGSRSNPTSNSVAWTMPVQGIPEGGHLGQPMCRGPMSEWLIERESRANGPVVENASNMNGEGDGGIGDRPLDMALDDRSVGERKWRTPKRPQNCGRCFGLLQRELVGYQPSCFVCRLTIDYQANLLDSMILEGVSGRSAMRNIIARRRLTPRPTKLHA